MSITRLEIAPAALDLRESALRLALGDAGRRTAEDEAKVLVSAEAHGLLSLAGLITAVRETSLVGAAWGVIQPGRAALIWPPRLVAGEPESTGDKLLAAVMAALPSTEVCIAQATLSAATSPDAARFIACGFHHAADLLYLACGRDCFPNACPSVPIDLISYSENDFERLIRLVEETYRETQDCPELNNVRDTADVLEGYRHNGVFAPDRWLIARAGAVDVGCLLLSDHPAEEQWELVYMGVTPEARGQGLGRALVRYAQWLTGQAARKRLVLAADARNEPAISIYRSVGFEPFDTRSIFLRLLN